MNRVPLCRALLRRFRKDEKGSIAVIFAVAIVPILLGIGAAIDFSRANSVRNTMQAALDNALLAGGKDGSTSWSQIASNIFNSNVGNNYSNTVSSSFSQPSSGTYSGSASSTVPTTFMGIFHIPTIPVSVRGAAIASPADNSCIILTLDHGQPTKSRLSHGQRFGSRRLISCRSRSEQTVGEAMPCYGSPSTSRVPSGHDLGLQSTPRLL